MLLNLFKSKKKKQYTKKPSRVFLIEKHFEHSKPEYRLCDVRRVGDFFAVERGLTNQYYLLEKGGKVRDRDDVSWLAVEDIPGLTDL